MRKVPTAAKKLTMLKTPKEVVDILGGIEKVCSMTGQDEKSVYHWIGGTFPARHHDWMTKALKRRGFRAPPPLWNQTKEIKAA